MASDSTTWIPHHVLVAPEGAAPRAWVLFLHGILGSGANWRTIARKLVSARPDWGAVLVDLRMHGRSQEAAPPHDLAAVAGDLERLAADLDRRGMPVAGVIGHSFGGKSALAYRGRAPAGLLETWVLDASPSIREEEPPRPEGDPGDGAIEVLRMLAALPGQFSNRDEFLASVTARGFSRPLAEWLAMNLVADGGAYRMRLDLGAIGELMADYGRQDLWPVVESTDLPGALRFVVAGRSSAVTTDDRARLEPLAASGRVSLHVLPDAGHWLHLDAAGELLRLFTDELVEP
ncbi:MAG TPA: alpha/beta hydrolase [Kofleriaceae bacterium]|nr:alpha/beta hydrolase [Kofleriaceae bacterium]